MPRLTNTHYLTTRKWLTEVWLTDPGAWANASPADQRLLHDYFEPSIPLSPDQALAHRRQVTTTNPSLPQRAGRALRRFQQVVQLESIWVPQPVISPKQGRQAQHAISARSVLQPHPDLAKLARALLQLAAKQGKPQKRHPPAA